MHVAWRLGVLAVLASVFALSWAQGFVVPLLLGIIIAYTLNPLVAWLEAIRIPRVVGTVIVMASVIGALVLGTYSLRGQMQTIIEQLPEAATKFATGLARMQIGQIGNMQKMQSAATEVEKATTQAAGGSAAPRQPATHVIVDQPTFKLGNFLWESSMGALGAMGQAAMVVFLVFFLLLGGDTFKRKLVRLTGPSLSKRKITVHILDDINGSIQKYMLMLLTTNLLVALLCWIAFQLDRPRERGRLGRRCGTAAHRSLPGARRHRRRDGDGCLHAVRIVCDGAAGCRRIAGDRYHRRNVRDHLDDRTNRQHEFSGRVHFAAVLGLAVGRLGNAAQHSHHRHRQGRVAARGAAAPAGRIVG